MAQIKQPNGWYITPDRAQALKDSNTQGFKGHFEMVSDTASGVAGTMNSKIPVKRDK